MTTEIKQAAPTADPWADLDRALAETRAQFYSAFGLPSFGAAESSGAYLRPARMDVLDTGTSFTVTAEIPGIPKDQLEIRVRGTNVEIRGEHAKETEEKGREFVHRERTYAGFYRRLELPEPVVGTQAKAKVENGVLELELPKVTPTPSSDEVKVPVA